MKKENPKVILFINVFLKKKKIEKGKKYSPFKIEPKTISNSSLLHEIEATYGMKSRPESQSKMAPNPEIVLLNGIANQHPRNVLNPRD